MTEIFETVLILSLFGFCITAVLLLLKPITAKKFPARWQYYVWVAVLVSMIVPIYKFIPEEEAQKLSFSPQNQGIITETAPKTDSNVNIPDTQIPQNEVGSTYIKDTKTDLKNTLAEMTDIFAYIWIIGVAVYILVVLVSYIIYLLKRRRNAFVIADNPIFEGTKKELGIRRKIKLKMSDDIGSPMLVGIIFPSVYIPAKSISDENMRMVFLHELTHYKRCDLIVKWLSLFVNAVHWFNPLAYLLCANISEACEISCDMAVTHNMPSDEQKIYMKTILDLAE